MNGYEYQITDDYNGEEKPAQMVQGVSVTAPGKPKDVNFICRTKPKADYADLQAVLPGSNVPRRLHAGNLITIQNSIATPIAGNTGIFSPK